MLNKEKILESLHTIKDVCEESDGDCKRCPMGDDRGCCIIQDLTPCLWDIASKEPTVWRALL